MNPTPFSGAVAGDTDLERIKARIRRERFVRFDRGRFSLWMMLFGVVCGVAAGAWWCVSYLQTQTIIPGGVPLTGEVIAETVIVALFWGVFIGGACGLVLALLALGLISMFRPVYVALFYSPEEFERQYPDQPPRIR